MIKIEVTIRPFQLDEVKATLERLGIYRFTSYQVLDHNASSGRKAVYRGSEYQIEEPKIKLEMLVPSLEVDDDLIEVLAHSLRAHADDDAILIYEVADAVRVRTGQRLDFVLG